jgi:type IV secretory pathway component VirB8
MMSPNTSRRIAMVVAILVTFAMVVSLVALAVGF